MGNSKGAATRLEAMAGIYRAKDGPLGRTDIRNWTTTLRTVLSIKLVRIHSQKVSTSRGKAVRPKTSPLRSATPTMYSLRNSTISF